MILWTLSYRETTGIAIGKFMKKHLRGNKGIYWICLRETWTLYKLVSSTNRTTAIMNKSIRNIWPNLTTLTHKRIHNWEKVSECFCELVWTISHCGNLVPFTLLPLLLLLLKAWKGGRSALSSRVLINDMFQ